MLTVASARGDRVGQVSSAAAAAASVGMQEMLMASRAGSSAGDPCGSDSRGHQTARGSGEEIHVRACGGTGKANITGEFIGDFHSYFKAAGADRRTEENAQARGLAEMSDRRLQDSRGEAAPSRVHESDSGIGGGQKDGQAVGDAHDEREAGYVACRTVATGQGRRGLGAADDGAVDLTELHRGAPVQGAGCGRHQRAPDHAELLDARRKRSEPQNECAAFHVPMPTHGRRA